MRLKSLIVALTVMAMAMTGYGGAVQAAEGGPSSIGVRQLTVEHLSDPLGIDQAHPRFGWKIASDTTGAAQSAYEIEVSADAAFTHKLWDTGKVTAESSVDVEYAGDALVSQTRYHWRARAWDTAGRVSAWSDPATFETSFVDPADFPGDWIGSPNRMPTFSLKGANWIWYPEGSPAQSAPSGTRYLRKTFSLPAGVEISSAQLQVTADDYFSLSVNGHQVVASPTSGEAWRTIRVTDIASSLRSGKNVIAASVQNAGVGAAGLVARLLVKTSDGKTADIGTDTTWVAANVKQDGWETESFDDSSWLPARIGAAYGSGPWGNSPSAPTPPAPLLRRDFSTDKKIASARVSVAGLGYYKMYINGKRVGNHELDPGFTDYAGTVLYSTYDVTDAIRSGDNTLGVSLGRGYFGQLQPDEWLASSWHDDPKLKLAMQITFTDGTTQRVDSDTSWQAGAGPTTSDSVWFGEMYDARLEQPGWDAPGFDASAWQPAIVVRNPGGELRSQLFPAIEVTDKLPVVATTRPSATSTVYDFGVPTAGWAALTFDGPAGAQVKMKYGEKLHQDGTVNNDNVFFTIQNYAYTLKGGGPEEFEPSFSYAGFRYLQVDAPAGVTITSVNGKRVHTAAKRTGDFSSSNDLLDKYDEAQAETILNNLHSVPTDTPMYEKRPYTADGFLSADSAISTFEMQNFYENWMRIHRDDQSADGTFGNTVPGSEGGKSTTDPVWSSSFVEVNWDLYTYYGNTRALADNYQGMKAWMDHYETNIATTGGIYTGFSYADWLSPAGAQAPEGTRLAATAYLYREADHMSRIAEALGHSDDAKHFEQLASTIRATFNDTFYDAEEGAYYDNKSAGYRQTSNLLPLSFGLVPADRKETVLKNLVADIESRGNHLNTGALGTKELLPVLTENGYADLAYKIATNRTYPGWGYWFTELGATTMWEEWGAESRSHDHAFLGTVVDWQYQQVAGIQSAAPGFRKVKIQPYPMDGLDQAAAHVESPRGTVASSWTRDADSFTLKVTVPVGSTADVYVPVRAGEVAVGPKGSQASPTANGFQKFTVGSGEFQFVAAPDDGGPTAPQSTKVVVPAQVPARSYGVAGTLAVTVTGSGGKPTGTVSLLKGTTKIASGTIGSSGRASLKLPGRSLAAGTHQLRVVYGGNSSFAASSATVKVTIAKAKVSVRASTSQRSYRASQRPVLTIKASPSAVLDGTVTVKQGRKVLKAHVRLVNGKAKITLPKLARKKGKHTLTVVYGGGRNTYSRTTHVTYRVRR